MKTAFLLHAVHDRHWALLWYIYGCPSVHFSVCLCRRMESHSLTTLVLQYIFFTRPLIKYLITVEQEEEIIKSAETMGMNYTCVNCVLVNIKHIWNLQFLLYQGQISNLITASAQLFGTWIQNLLGDAYCCQSLSIFSAAGHTVLPHHASVVAIARPFKASESKCGIRRGRIYFPRRVHSFKYNFCHGVNDVLTLMAMVLFWHEWI